MKQNLTKHFVLIALVAILGVIVGCTTFLHYAARRGNISAVRNQLDKGVDVNTKDNRGDTALMKASARGYLEITKLLIERGADINAKNNRGDTALMKASARGYLEITKLLIERGADINAKDNNDQTACTIAAWRGCIETVKLLIDKGADINIPSGKAILIKEVDPFQIVGGVYLKEIDGRQIESVPGRRGLMLGRGLMTTLSPGVHNIKVEYHSEGVSTTTYGEPISLFINVKSGHIYAVKHKIKAEEKKWTAWIEKIK